MIMAASCHNFTFAPEPRRYGAARKGTAMNAHQLSETHLVHRIGWLRAAVLGANDGLISTASLIVGVAAATPTKEAILVAGLAGLAAGAMAMAAGEYVSVSSQSDTEAADLARETAELATDPAAELAELAGIYVSRGLEPALALEVATQLTKHGALEAHLRDELGMSDHTMARPIQAAVTSAVTFSAGATIPVLVALAVPLQFASWAVAGGSVIALAMLGMLAAKAGGSKLVSSTLRVTFWGAMAMGVTAGVGAIFGTAL
jgi:VIT1/CCC1 family predicted Fe2+/Mn2+ transporter